MFRFWLWCSMTPMLLFVMVSMLNVLQLRGWHSQYCICKMKETVWLQSVVWFRMSFEIKNFLGRTDNIWNYETQPDIVVGHSCYMLSCDDHKKAEKTKYMLYFQRQKTRDSTISNMMFYSFLSYDDVANLLCGVAWTKKDDSRLSCWPLCGVIGPSPRGF